MKSQQPLFLDLLTHKNPHPAWFYMQNREDTWAHARSTRTHPLFAAVYN